MEKTGKKLLQYQMKLVYTHDIFSQCETTQAELLVTRRRANWQLKPVYVCGRD